MFARTLSIHLKPNTLTDFTTTFDKEILPMLRKQAGFRDEIVLAASDTNNVSAISLWDSQAQADAYATTAYADVVKVLDKFLDGAPKVRVMNVVHSTSHKLTAASVVAA
jgi:hypothetical protein